MYVGSYVHSISLTKLEFVTEGVIVVSNGKIIFVQNHSNDWAKVQKIHDVKKENVHVLKKGQFLIPGFVDTHIHASQYPNIGLGYDLPLLEWLEVYTFPLESKFECEEFAKKVYDAVVVSNAFTQPC